MSRERIKNQTRKLLKDNLMELLEKKPIAKITIKELCEKADINRSTYYKYYLDQYDQLEKIEDEIFIDMGAFVYNIVKDNNKSEQSIVINSILSYIEQNKYEFKILLEKGDLNFQTKMLSYIGKIVFQQLNRNDLRTEMKYIYTVQGSFGIVKEWIIGNIEIDVDNLTKTLVDINSRW